MSSEHRTSVVLDSMDSVDCLKLNDWRSFQLLARRLAAYHLVKTMTVSGGIRRTLVWRLQ